MSQIAVLIQTEWGDQPPEAADDCYFRKLATITSIESELGDSTYSFSGHIRYRIAKEESLVVVDEYNVKGLHLDGPDLGQVEYLNSSPWFVPVAEDRRFCCRTELIWRDSNNSDARLNLTLRGTLLENGALAYISSTTQGDVALSESVNGEVYVSTPACW